MAVHLTKSVIDELTCPSDKRQVLFFDAKLPGFGLSVTRSGTKTFLVQYKRRNRVQRVTVGRMGVITPAEARRRALELIGAVQAGRDPAAERKSAGESMAAAAEERARAGREKSARDAFTCLRLIEQWTAIKLKNRSVTYRREAPRCLRRIFAEVLDEPAKSVDRVQIQSILDREAARAAVQARNARVYGRAAWNWALQRGLVDRNPFVEVVVEHQTVSRDRVLDDDELAEAWRAASRRPYPFGPIVQLLILTLQRKGEVTGIRLSEISADGATWTIPAHRSKNRRPHIVHLVPEARRIIGELEARWNGAEVPDLLFTTSGDRAVSGHSKAKRRLSDEIMLERATKDVDKDEGERRSPAGWRLHDFRRTGVTKLAELSVPPHVSDRILNHVTGAISGVAAVYQRFEFLAERRAALELWAQHVLTVASGAPRKTNVLPLLRRQS